MTERRSRPKLGDIAPTTKSMMDAHVPMPETTILVVDDDISTRGALGNALTDEGFGVTTAASGDEAWEYFNEYAPDVVISDVRMRHGDGVALLERVRGVEGKAPVFILMSGFSDIAPREALAKGANAYFNKPCWLADLLDAVENGLGNGPAG